jgi:hypothetical protein
MSTLLLDCNVELLALTRAKSSTLQPNKRGSKTKKYIFIVSDSLVKTLRQTNVY